MKTEQHGAAASLPFLVANRNKNGFQAPAILGQGGFASRFSSKSAFGVSLLRLLAKIKSIGHSHTADDAVIHRSHAIHGTDPATPGRVSAWALEDRLCQDPEKGSVIQGAGGFRKIRMGLPGRGKRGGCRIIYLHVKSASRIYFVYLYPKNEEVDLSADQKKSLKQISHAIYEEVKKDPALK